MQNDWKSSNLKLYIFSFCLAVRQLQQVLTLRGCLLIYLFICVRQHCTFLCSIQADLLEGDTRYRWDRIGLKVYIYFFYQCRSVNPRFAQKGTLYTEILHFLKRTYIFLSAVLMIYIICSKLGSSLLPQRILKEPNNFTLRGWNNIEIALIYSFIYEVSSNFTFSIHVFLDHSQTGNWIPNVFVFNSVKCKWYMHLHRFYTVKQQCSCTCASRLLR